MRTTRSLDLILFGGTGFTGGLTAEYLAGHAPADLRWGLAGRDRGKLEALRRRLAAIRPACDELPLRQVDAADEGALRDLAAQARVVITTVGPYLQYGEPLVAACAAEGTDYVDLTGEPEFVDRMWLNHHDTACRTGARLVHSCGFDSIPHDLGVYFTVQQLPADQPIRIEGYVCAHAEFSGGTFHSAIHAFARAREMRAIARARRLREAWPGDRRIGALPARIHPLPMGEGWGLPFPSIDPQVVRRSAAALACYGRDFRYAHYLVVPNAGGVAKLVGGIGAAAVAAQFGPTRAWLLAQRKPGEGPSPERRARSWFRVRFDASAGDRRLRTEVSGGDPGYGETAKMLGESALCLAFDPLPARAGQLTTAVAMGDALLARLQHAGLRFTVLA